MLSCAPQMPTTKRHSNEGIMVAKQIRKLTGHWWVPGDASTRIPGTLNIRNDDLGELHLIGSFSEHWLPRADVILGHCTDVDRVSLHHCQYRGGPWGPTPSSQPHQSFFDAPVTYVGAHFARPEDAQFLTLHWAMADLLQWLRPGNFLTIGGTTDTRVVVESRDGLGTIQATADLGPAILTFTAAGPLIESTSDDVVAGGRVVVAEKAWADLTAQIALPIDDLFRLAFIVRDFFTFLHGGRVDIESVHGILPPPAVIPQPPIYQRPVEIYARGLRDVALPPSKHYGGGVFTYPEVADRFEPLLQGWASHSRDFEAVHELFFNSVADDRLHPRLRFLQLAQAVESYHRLKFGGKFETDATFEIGLHQVMLAALPQGLPSDYRSAIRSKLRYLNEYSLRKRIKNLVHDFPLIEARFIPHSAEFADEVVFARNYLTHYDQGQREHFQSLSLTSLTRFLRLILELYFLRDIGFSEENLESIVARDFRYTSVRRWSSHRVGLPP